MATSGLWSRNKSNAGLWSPQLVRAISSGQPVGVVVSGAIPPSGQKCNGGSRFSYENDGGPSAVWDFLRLARSPDCHAPYTDLVDSRRGRARSGQIFWLSTRTGEVRRPVSRCRSAARQVAKRMVLFAPVARCGAATRHRRSERFRYREVPRIICDMRQARGQKAEIINSNTCLRLLLTPWAQRVRRILASVRSPASKDLATPCAGVSIGA